MSSLSYCDPVPETGWGRFESNKMKERKGKTVQSFNGLRPFVRDQVLLYKDEATAGTASGLISNPVATYQAPGSK